MNLRTLVAASVLFSATASAESVTVKYRGIVDITHYSCEAISRSSVITRLCYRNSSSHVIVGLKGVYYEYCGVPAGVVSDWRAANSMGRYYNSQIKHAYSCRK